MEDKNKQRLKTVFVWIFIASGLFLAYSCVQDCANEENMTINYSQFIKMVDEGNVSRIRMEGSKISGISKNNGIFFTYIPPQDETLLPLLRERNVQIEVISDTNGYEWILDKIIFLPIIILFLLFFRSSVSQANRNMSFIKSKAKIVSDKTRKVSFKDVAGMENIVGEVEEVVKYLKDPKEFGMLGGRMPKGVLLTGPPGTGKTLIARAIAGEAGVPFFSISGSDFVEMFVGVGASRVRDLFEEARKTAKAIIFVDEIDAIGRVRGSGKGNSHDEREQTLNQILVEMDGMESGDGIVVIAATNRPDILDPALLRPGRFDTRIEVPRPDINGLEEILKVHTAKIKLDKKANLRNIAEEAIGMVGADLENIANQGAIIARRLNKEQVEEDDLRAAIERVVMGVENKRAVGAVEQKLAAVHEAGHALAGILQKDFPLKLRIITIVPHGRAGGFTWFAPLEDRSFRFKNEAFAELRMILGGRAAEEIFLKDISDGASGDIEKAMRYARAMVCEMGFGKKGPLATGAVRENEFFGVFGDNSIGEITKQEIDKEIQEIISGCYEEAKKIILENKEAMERIINLLMKEKRVLGERIYQLAKDFRAETAAEKEVYY